MRIAQNHIKETKFPKTHQHEMHDQDWTSEALAN